MKNTTCEVTPIVSPDVRQPGGKSGPERRPRRIQRAVQQGSLLRNHLVIFVYEPAIFWRTSDAIEFYRICYIDSFQL